MNKLFETILLASLLIGFNGSAQENASSSLKGNRNTIGIYVGFLEYNINFERNIVQRPKSYSNIRLGYGYWTDLQSAGHYFNPSFVHLTGKQSSHLELNLGFKFIVSGTRSGLDGSQNFLLPDVFVGYRYEKPGRGEVFRIGIGIVSIISIGGAIKF